MKTIRRSYLYSLLLAFAGLVMGLSVSAQDIHFSQFNESPLTLNPALCGAYNGQLEAIVNYRTQWPGYNTMAASLQLHNICPSWQNAYFSPGLSFFSDKSGTADIQSTDIDATIASGVSLNKSSSLSAGLQAGWAQNSINFQSIQWGDQVSNGQYDASIPSGEGTAGTSVSYFDVSAGMYYHYKTGQTTVVSSNQFQLNLGAAVYHVNEPDVSYYGEHGPATDLYMRYVFHGDAIFDLSNTNLSLVPAFMVLYQGPASEVDFGTKLRFKLSSDSRYTDNRVGSAFDIGAYYRWDNAIIAMAGFEKGPYSAYLSYDISTTSLANETSGTGAFEISIKYLMPQTIMTSRAMY